MHISSRRDGPKLTWIWISNLLGCIYIQVFCLTFSNKGFFLHNVDLGLNSEVVWFLVMCWWYVTKIQLYVTKITHMGVKIPRFLTWICWDNFSLSFWGGSLKNAPRACKCVSGLQEIHRLSVLVKVHLYTEYSIYLFEEKTTVIVLWDGLKILLGKIDSNISVD